MEYLFATLVTVFPLVFTNNLLMSLVKLIAGKTATAPWLRVILGMLSVSGILATAALTGSQFDFNQISDIGSMIFQTAFVGVASHYSYRVIKGA